MSSDIEETSPTTTITRSSAGAADSSIFKNNLTRINQDLNALKNKLQKLTDSSVLTCIDLEEFDVDVSEIVDTECLFTDLNHVQHHLDISINEIDSLRNSEIRHDSNLKKDFFQKINSQYESYKNLPSGKKLGKEEWYKDYKTQLWELKNPNVPMPPLFEGQEDEDDEDLVVADTTVVLHCPLTTNYLESPMTSKFCGHSYSKRAIVEYLCNSKKQCPVVGCVHTISVKDLYENKKLERRIERIRRYKLAREKSQNYTTLQ